MRENAICRKRQVAQQVVTHGVSAELVHQFHRSYDVASGFGDTLSLQRDKAMHRYLAWQRQPCRHKHRRPVEAVKARDVLANYMRISRPVTLKHGRVIWKADGGQVVGQGIEPDINDVIRITREWHSPGLLEPGHASRDGKIAY